MIAIKELFTKAGIEDVRPTDEALKAMGLSRRRFTQLVEGTNKTEIRLTEVISIKAWVNGIREINPEKILSENH